MIDHEENNRRSVNDTESLLMANMLTQKLDNFMERFEKFVENEKSDHRRITETLIKHEEMVIKNITSWKWVTSLSELMGAMVLSIGIFFYQELMVLKDSVLIHHAQDILRVQRQDNINEIVAEKIKVISGNSQKE